MKTAFIVAFWLTIIVAKLAFSSLVALARVLVFPLRVDETANVKSGEVIRHAS